MLTIFFQNNQYTVGFFLRNFVLIFVLPNRNVPCAFRNVKTTIIKRLIFSVYD